MANIYDVVDRLKGICHANGLSNQAAEEEIVTSVFLFKYLSDQFRKKAIQTAKKEKKPLPEVMREGITFGIYMKGVDTIDYLMRKLDSDMIADLFDSTLVRISNYPQNKKLGEPLFTKITKKIEKRNDFVREILPLLNELDFIKNETDYFAPVFEYMIKDYNVASGKYAEYFTPGEIAYIIAKILTVGEIKGKKIYDPSAGSGTLLLHLAHELCTEEIYSQDISTKSTRLLRINMILNGYVKNIPHIKQGDTLLNPIQEKFDYIVSNPPFKVDFSFTRDDIVEKWEKCFPDGVPEIPAKKKDSMPVYLCFIQHVLWALNKNGKAAVVVPAGFLSIHGGIEEKIRKRLITNGWLSGVLIMPKNTFANTQTKVAVIFIDKSQWNQSVTLYDASKMGTSQKVGKNMKTVLSQDNIETIISEYQKKEKISIAKIADNDYSLIPGQYVDYTKQQKVITSEEFAKKISAIKKQYDSLKAVETELDSKIQQTFALLLESDSLI